MDVRTDSTLREVALASLSSSAAFVTWLSSKIPFGFGKFFPAPDAKDDGKDVKGGDDGSGDGTGSEKKKKRIPEKWDKWVNNDGKNDADVDGKKGDDDPWGLGKRKKNKDTDEDDSR